MDDGAGAPAEGIVIERDLAPGVSLVVLLGEHDLASADELQSTLDDLLASESNVVVDVSETSFLDVSILRVLYGAHRAAAEQRRRVVLAWGTSPEVRRVFTLTGLLDRVTHAEGREQAVLAAQEGRAA